ncbi:MAG: fold metallo-hydrolase [Solirubrobacterales bacterium]|nr:fold metallo-hydrolase [Solirubrobacterales bacterium]
MSSPVLRITRLGLVNAFLVREDDGLTLIDTAVGGSAKAILAAADRAGAAITRVALTHGHSDHIGSLDALHQRLPDAEILISARDARLLVKDKTPQEGEPADAKVRGGVPGVSTTPTRLLSDGDAVGSLRVVASPGHTPGHVAFFDERDGTLYCGDAFHTIGGVHTTARPGWRFPLPGMATWHKPTALASANVLRALTPQRLAPGHGAVVEDPGSAMDAAIARGA